MAASIPVFETIHAIEHGEEMTAENSGVRGASRLEHGIKYLINYAGNSLTNQHSDVRHSHEVLADESKCEFILGIDTVMCDSLKYADVIFPDLLRIEQQSQTSGGADWGHIVTGQPVPTHRDEQKSAYEMARLMAASLASSKNSRWTAPKATGFARSTTKRASNSPNLAFPNSKRRSAPAS